MATKITITTPTGVEVAHCGTCEHCHPVSRRHCPSCGLAHIFPTCPRK